MAYIGIARIISDDSAPHQSFCCHKPTIIINSISVASDCCFCITRYEYSTGKIDTHHTFTQNIHRKSMIYYIRVMMER